MLGRYTTGRRLRWPIEKSPRRSEQRRDQLISFGLEGLRADRQQRDGEAVILCNKAVNGPNEAMALQPSFHLYYTAGTPFVADRSPFGIAACGGEQCEMASFQGPMLMRQ